MKKIHRTIKFLKRQQAIHRYSAKRRSKKWKERKRSKKFQNWKKFIQEKRKNKQAKRKTINFPAPHNFSLINNTEETLKYFNDAEAILKNKKNVIFDVSKVYELTSPTIALLVASIKDIEFTHNSNIYGNAPIKKNLNKLFVESGFYNHVSSSTKFSNNKNDILHKEVNRKVVPEIATEAYKTGIMNVFKNEIYFEPLYEILIECMSNTNNHADLKIKGKCNWWLYVHNDKENNISSYSFVDLGVGIFESLVIQNYIKNKIKGTAFYPNIRLVNKLISGELQSRIEKDRGIRGKGIPQIASHSKHKYFKSFYIITNDLKINLKTNEKVQLKNKFSGTFLYWELYNA